MFSKSSSYCFTLIFMFSKRAFIGSLFFNVSQKDLIISPLFLGFLEIALIVSPLFLGFLEIVLIVSALFSCFLEIFLLFHPYCSACMRENGMQFNEIEVSNLANAIFQVRNKYRLTSYTLPYFSGTL